MAHWTRRIPFQVDVAGVIQIMGKSLYSRGDAPIRELIQNAHDAIIRRRQRDLDYKGRIDIRLDESAGTLSVTDDGIGLSAEEAERYLGTLGIGVTGLLKGHHPSSSDVDHGEAGEGLIGQFGIGLFSAFLLADKIVVVSRRADLDAGVRWAAGEGSDIELSEAERSEPGTTVTLQLKPLFRNWASQTALVEEAVREYADFLPVPVFVNDGPTRVNVINVAWFDPTPDREAIELELQGYFHETPLDVIPIRGEDEIGAIGALYVTPQRVPGFAGDPVVTTTIRRMVISRQTRDLLPAWAHFLRGVLEVPRCEPTASREDLVRNFAFESVRRHLEDRLYEHFERLAQRDPAAMQSILAWHRYTWAGAAIHDRRLRALLRSCYRFQTSQGPLSFEELIPKCAADPLFETEAEVVVWYNMDRRQERWMTSLFAGSDAPCVHTIRSFEESLLGAMLADLTDTGKRVALRTASPGSHGFAELILGIRDMEDASAEWQEFLGQSDAKVMVATFRADQPVMAFLNEKHDLQATFEDLRKTGVVPAGFQRLIDSHFDESETGRHEILLNREHKLVGRALSQRTGTPLASVLRLLVINALNNAGAAVKREVHREMMDDLDWIAEALWGRN
ncbi:MAG: hypothetical protein DWH91_05765 [Planctomycetota bacterium]|nr:MAG: hypothetical protein DWH91_05765 [Planctomycetota bacterium]